MTTIAESRSADVRAADASKGSGVTTKPRVVGRLVTALRVTLAILFLIFFVSTLVRLRPELHGAAYVALGFVLALVCYKCLPRCDFRIFCLYICGFAVFNGFRTLADGTGNPVNFAYPIDIDKAIFGAVPTVWLQERFYVNGEIRTLEWATTIVYATYFWGHYLVAFVVWALRRDLLVQHIGAIIATIFLGLAVYYLLPTSPPWFAAETGHLQDVVKIVPIVTGEVSSEAYANSANIAGTNHVAAMPSLHCALTVIIAMTLWRMHRLAGLAGWTYAAAMGFSLVYLGEHYVVDVAAGVVTAVAAWRVVAKLRQTSIWAARDVTASRPLPEPAYSQPS